jgi:hypothetical protein
MKIRKSQAAWAVKIWVILSVFILPFVGPLELAAWGLLGGVLGLVWRSLPEEPEPPVEKLPFQDQYEGRQVPRPDSPSPLGEGRGEGQSTPKDG